MCFKSLTPLIHFVVTLHLVLASPLTNKDRKVFSDKGGIPKNKMKRKGTEFSMRGGGGVSSSIRFFFNSFLLKTSRFAHSLSFMLCIYGS